MSTFDGIIREIPGIRVDFFRGVTENPPLACFLSHIHSDHLSGLDTYRGRHVYCSAATKAMLLKLQRRSSRINFQQGILEKEDITYKHQKRRLKGADAHANQKSLPLETPTDIELEPGRQIRVTLFDANHCPGAVMFLFETSETTVLYTGDIRCEAWHVDALARNPCMVEYTMGLRRLDKVYLDTSFTEDVVFQTKAEGLQELVKEVSKYPRDTKFYFSAWTYGYEEVWIALAKTLNTRIHVDQYKLNVYRALQVKVDDENYVHLSPEAPALTGFARGNGYQPGLLTDDESVRLHSCEKGTRCSVMSKEGVVLITPIVAHISSHSDMVEVGIGGGADDLEQTDEMILTPQDAEILLQNLTEAKNLQNKVKASVLSFLRSVVSANRAIAIPLVRDEDDNDLSGLQRALESLIKVSEHSRGTQSATALPNRIKFPYSRHSSYGELCYLLQVLRPKDVWPCTVEPRRWINQGITIKNLFGEYCTGETYSHDEHMVHLASLAEFQDSDQPNSQESSHSVDRPSPNLQISEDVKSISAASGRSVNDSSLAAVVSVPASDEINKIGHVSQDYVSTRSHQRAVDLTLDEDSDNNHTAVIQRDTSVRKRKFDEFTRLNQPCKDSDSICEDASDEGSESADVDLLFDSQDSSFSQHTSETRRIAVHSALGMLEWTGLLSTTNNHSRLEAELGEG